MEETFVFYKLHKQGHLGTYPLDNQDWEMMGELHWFPCVNTAWILYKQINLLPIRNRKTQDIYEFLKAEVNYVQVETWWCLLAIQYFAVRFIA